MATGTPRVLWKGAITFGLVHIPVALHSATTETGIDFDWLDKRTMDPVGYKRINKKTGKEVDKDNIVKGIETDSGEYVVLTDEEIKAAYPKSTQTIEIECFVPLQDVPFIYLERPYYLSPVGKGEKVYALLRETLLKKGRAGIARVVIQTKQHLAALVPTGPVLVLNLLRWGKSIRNWEQLDLPAPGIKGVGLKEREMEMAGQLVEDMTSKWDPSQFHDSFAEDVMSLVHKKVEAGQTETVIQPEAEEAAVAASNVVDLTELLQRSLRGGKKEPKKGTKDKHTARRSAANPRDAKPAAQSRSHGRRDAA
jgi:DNA end-binding protein Ku